MKELAAAIPLPTEPSKGTIINPLLDINVGQTNPLFFLQKFLPMLVTLVLVVVSVVFLFILLSGGIAWMTAGGDKVQVEAARSRITNALIGLFIVFAVFALVTLVEGLFGIKILTIDISKIIIP